MIGIAALTACGPGTVSTPPEASPKATIDPAAPAIRTCGDAYFANQAALNAALDREMGAFTGTQVQSWGAAQRMASSLEQADAAFKAAECPDFLQGSREAVLASDAEWIKVWRIYGDRRISSTRAVDPLTQAHDQDVATRNGFVQRLSYESGFHHTSPNPSWPRT